REGQDPFQGEIKLARLYNRALSAGEITDLFNDGMERFSTWPGGGIVPPGGDTGPAIPPGTPTLTAEQLANEYATDTDAANAKYKDKLIVLTGTVITKTANVLGAVSFEVKANGKYKVFF